MIEVNGVDELVEEVHGIAKDKGFWDTERNVGELLMLVTSELGEALEAHRKGRKADDNMYVEQMDASCAEDPLLESNQGQEIFKKHFEEYIKDTFEDEIADAVIRLFDLAGGLNIDLLWHIRQKIEYNKTRERLHGKKY